MGRIAELYEKKALGTLTDAEAKELTKLLAEAKAVRKDAEGETEGEGESESEGEGAEDEEKAIDKMAQQLADAAQMRMEKGMKKLLDEMRADKTVVTSTHDNSGGFVVDKKLGKASNGYKVSIEELSEIKEAVPGRENKKIKEISARTKMFLTALLVGDKQKLQLLAESTSSGADGGYLVPDEFANMIVEDIRDVNLMRQLAATPIPITSDTLHLPGITSRPYANWRAEKAVKNTSTATFTETVFTPFSLATIVGLSNELVMDASLGVNGNIVNYIAGLMATSLNEKEEAAFWTGSGTGQPKGVHGNTGRTFDSGAGSTDTQRADNLIKAYQNTPQGYRNKAVWVMNMGTLFEVGRLKDSQNRYLLTDLAGSPTQTIKGRPVYESNYLAGGEAIFGDLDFYQIVDRQGITVDTSKEATVGGSNAFEKNLTYIRVEKRVDAKPTLAAAFTTVLGLGTP